MFKRFMGRFRFQPFFEGDGGTGSGGGAGGGGGQGANQDTQPFASFPDEASFNARMKREGKAQLEATAKELGFESYEAMQTAAKAQKEANEKSKTDLEKEKARADKAEADGKTALQVAQNISINAEIKVLAVQAGFIDPADAAALIDRTGIQVDDQGNVTGAKEAVEALAKAKPHLIGTGKPSGSPGSGGNGNRQTGDGAKETEFALNLAKKRAEENKQGSTNPYFK